MNIYNLPDSKVTVTHDSMSLGTSTQGLADKYLVVGSEYTVEKTEIRNHSTMVLIKELPFVKFNSVHFVDVKKQSKADDKKHPQWKKYNK